MIGSTLPQVMFMGLSRKIRLIRRNIANAWAMLFQTSQAPDDHKIWDQTHQAIPETGSD